MSILYMKFEKIIDEYPYPINKLCLYKDGNYVCSLNEEQSKTYFLKMTNSNHKFDQISLLEFFEVNAKYSNEFKKTKYVNLSIADSAIDSFIDDLNNYLLRDKLNKFIGDEHD